MGPWSDVEIPDRRDRATTTTDDDRAGSVLSVLK
jgi:hypothetical protein